MPTNSHRPPPVPCPAMTTDSVDLFEYLEDPTCVGSALSTLSRLEQLATIRAFLNQLPEPLCRGDETSELALHVFQFATDRNLIPQLSANGDHQSLSRGAATKVQQWQQQRWEEARKQEEGQRKRAAYLQRIKKNTGWEDFPDCIPQYMRLSKNSSRDTFGNTILIHWGALAESADLSEALAFLHEHCNGQRVRDKVIKAAIEHFATKVPRRSCGRCNFPASRIAHTDDQISHPQPAITTNPKMLSMTSDSPLGVYGEIDAFRSYTPRQGETTEEEQDLEDFTFSEIGVDRAQRRNSTNDANESNSSSPLPSLGLLDSTDCDTFEGELERRMTGAIWLPSCNRVSTVSDSSTDTDLTDSIGRILAVLEDQIAEGRRVLRQKKDELEQVFLEREQLGAAIQKYSALLHSSRQRSAEAKRQYNTLVDAIKATRQSGGNSECGWQDMLDLHCNAAEERMLLAQSEEAAYAEKLRVAEDQKRRIEMTTEDIQKEIQKFQALSQSDLPAKMRNLAVQGSGFIDDLQGCCWRTLLSDT